MRKVGKLKEVQKIEKKAKDFDIKDLYTPLSVAKKEIWKRWNDKELRKKVEDSLGKIPHIFKGKPRAVIFRNIATPNFESNLFHELANCIELDSAYIEYKKDKFCTRNQDKLTLGKMIFFHGRNKKEDNLINNRKIIDIKGNDNKPFDKIMTLWGEKFVDFHHRIFHLFNNKKVVYFDASKFKNNGKSAKDVYIKVLSFFVCHGVIFENYIAKDNFYEKKFTNEVVLPAIAEVERIFGVKPLIVPLLPLKEETSREWMWYPGHLEKEIMKSINK